MTTRLGSYDLIERLGEGPHGAIHLAVDTARDRMVALKLYRTLDAAARSPRSTELHEAMQGLSGIRSPYVASIFGCSAAGESPVFLAREHVAGATLHAIRHHVGPLPIVLASAVLHSVARALMLFEAAGRAHGNLKLSNVLIQQSGAVKVVDPAFAGPYLGPTPAGINVATGQYGAPAFLAPELFAGTPATAASDIYALGILGYVLLCGRYPFDEPDVARLRRKKLLGDYLDPRAAAPDLPDVHASLLRTCLEKGPEDRQLNAEEVAEGLASWLAAQDLAPSQALEQGIQSIGYVFLVAGRPADGESAVVASTPSPVLAATPAPGSPETVPWLGRFPEPGVTPVAAEPTPAARLNAPTLAIGQQDLSAIAPPLLDPLVVPILPGLDGFGPPGPVVPLAAASQPAAPPPPASPLASPLSTPAQDRPPLSLQSLTPPPATPVEPESAWVDPLAARGGPLPKSRHPVPSLLLDPDADMRHVPQGPIARIKEPSSKLPWLGGAAVAAAAVAALVWWQSQRSSAESTPAAPGSTEPAKPAVDAKERLVRAERLADGVPEQALQAAREAVEANPDEVLAQALLARALLRAGGYDEAMGILDAALVKAPDLLELHKLRIRTELARGHNRPAAEAARAALVKHGSDAELYLFLGRAHLADRRLDEAAEALATAGQMNPELGEAALLLGDARLRQRKFVEARAAFQRAVELMPRDPEGYVGLAKSLRALGRGGDATALLERGLTLVPDPSVLEYAVGRITLKDGRPKDALPHFEAHLKRSPDDWRGHFAVGLAHLRLAQPDAAVTALMRAAAIRPNQAEIQHNLGLAEATRGNMEPALIAFGAAIRLRYALPEAHCEKAKLLLRAGRADEARRALEETVKVDPQSVAARALLAHKQGVGLQAQLLGLPCGASGTLDVDD